MQNFTYEPEQLVHDALLRKSLDRLVEKSQKGYMSVIIFFGPTRAGKSMLAIKCMSYCARKLGVDFNNDHIYWQVDNFLEDAKGKMNQPYLIDEGALDLLSNEWYEETQKKLIKYHMTAAKYRQIVAICIQNFGKMPAHIATDFHTRLIECRINSKTLENGYYRIFNKSSNNYIYDLCKKNDQAKLRKAGAHPTNGTKMPLEERKIREIVNLEKYEKDKDDAIQTIIDGQKGNDKWKTDVHKIIHYVGKEKKPIENIETIAEIIGMKSTTIKNHFLYKMLPK
jgi:hypothetical protein